MEELVVDLPDQGLTQLDIPSIDVVLSDTAFAAMFGVHFDLRLNDRVFWRIVQPDLLVTAYGGEAQTHFRISSAIGFGF